METRAAAHVRLGIQRMNMYAEDAKIAAGAVPKAIKARKTEDKACDASNNMFWLVHGRFQCCVDFSELLDC